MKRYKTYDELLAEYNARFAEITANSTSHTKESYDSFNALSFFMLKFDKKLTKKYIKAEYKLGKKEFKQEYGFFARLKKAFGFATKICETKALTSEEHIEQANAEKLEEIDQMRMDQQKLQQQLTQTQQQLEQAKHYIQQQRLTQQVTNDMQPDNC